MKRGFSSSTNNHFNIPPQHKSQIVSKSIYKTQNRKNQIWCILYLFIALICCIAFIKAYHHILYKDLNKDPIEQSIMFPLYSDTWSNSNQTNQYLIQNITKNNHNNNLRQIKAITRSVEKYFPFKLGGGLTHLNIAHGYYIKMAIGKSRKEFKFYIDSGCPLTWLYCKWPDDTNNLQLHGPNGLYNPFDGALFIGDDSSACLAYSKVRKKKNDKNICQLIISYEDSFKLLSILVKDTIILHNQFGDEVVTIMDIGCAHSCTGRSVINQLSKKKLYPTDGQIGIDKEKSSFVQHLIKAEIIQSFVITICIKKKMYMSNSCGFIIFGRPNFMKTMLNMEWTRLVPFIESNSKVAYKIQALKIYMGSYEYELPHGRLMQLDIDTGSTSLYFVEYFKRILYNRIIARGTLKLYKLDPQLDSVYTCLRFPQSGDVDPQQDFDTINIEVQGSRGLVNISIFPDQYLRWHGFQDDIGKCFCINIVEEPSSDLRPDLFGTLGVHIFHDTLIVFDNERYKFGWKKSNCNEMKEELKTIERSGDRVLKRPRLNYP